MDVQHYHSMALCPCKSHNLLGSLDYLLQGHCHDHEVHENYHFIQPLGHQHYVETDLDWLVDIDASSPVLFDVQILLDIWPVELTLLLTSSGIEN